MEFLKDICNITKWEKFIERLESEYEVDKKMCAEIRKMISENSINKFHDQIINKTFFDAKARKLEIPKLGSNKKRTVYCFNNEQSIFLKFVNFLLYEFDYLFSNNLFSYRSNITPTQIARKISKIVRNGGYFAYKVDIHDYFRSINKDRVIKIIEEKIPDKDLISFFKELLSQNQFYYNNQLITEEAGAIPGMPISGFFANIYLSDVDHYFEDKNISYFRYADDIIIISNSQDKVEEYSKILKEKLYEHDLTINPKKELFYTNGEPIEFLGIRYDKSIIDISQITFKKMKGKIKRAARSLRRWMLKNNISYGQTLYAFNKKFNNKFYCKTEGEICWALWYFPIINTSKTLKKIDEYYQQEARYIKTGKHNKMNFKEVNYKYLKTYHYQPLVTCYYRFKEDGTIPINPNKKQS